MNDLLKQSLIKAIQRTSLDFGDFTLRSGEKTNFYIDLRKLTLDSEGLDLVIQSLHRTLHIEKVGREFKEKFDAIGGPSLGADPIVGAFIYNQGRVKEKIRGFLIRKENKEYGRGGPILGSVKKGDKVVVVDDVATTGDSLLRACKIIQDFGCVVLKAIVIVDRMAGAVKLFEDNKIPFTSILKIDDVAVKTYQSPFGKNPVCL